jgi:hypothetical protein
MASRETDLSEVMKHGRIAARAVALGRRLAAISAAATLASTLVACTIENSYDNPNRAPAPYRQRIAIWKVQDVASSKVLASGCEQELPAVVPSVQAAPGQRLVLEVREWVVEKRDPGSSSATWCSDDQLVSKTMVDWVDNLSCFDFPSTGGVRMLSWEPLLLPVPASRVCRG